MYHSSLNRGNLIELLKWAAETDETAEVIFNDASGNATYLSPEIQNELLNIMANQIRSDIAQEVHISFYLCFLN